MIEVLDRDAAGAAVFGRRTIGANELPGLVAESAPRALRIAVERDAPPRGQEVDRETAQARSQPVMEVERARDRERDLLLDPCERPRDLPSLGPGPSARPERGSRRVRAA